jgi:hypothetical protein
MNGSSDSLLLGNSKMGFLGMANAKGAGVTASEACARSLNHGGAIWSLRSQT